MALEALSTSEQLNFIIYDTISATPSTCNDSSETTLLPETCHRVPEFGGTSDSSSSMVHRCCQAGLVPEGVERRLSTAVQGRKKRRKRTRVCKNKEDAEKQRMTHIAVERNRRKQMNEHLAVLLSLMPESYVQRGDQATIVGGAIDYVKELEHLLQSLEAQKLVDNLASNSAAANVSTFGTCTAPFAQFFAYPQYTWSKLPNKHASKNKAAMADIEVTLIETHANLRILARKNLRQVTKMVAGFQALYLTILHLNVTTLDPMVLYSVSAKVEEGCQLNSADDIACAAHQILRIIEEEATTC